MADQRRREGRVFVHPPGEPAVESGEESLLGRFAAAQEQGAQGRGERQGVEGRDHDRHGDRHRELLEQPPRDAARKRYGDEYGQQDDGRGDDGRSHVLHGFERRGAGVHPVGDIDLRGLHDHDGVVHHQTDRQHQSQQRNDVDREPQQRKEREGADQRYGDGDQRNDRGAPVLNEEVDNADHQHEGYDERGEDVADAGVDAGRGVHDRRCRDAVGQAFAEPRHFGLDLVAHGHGVAARLLIDDDKGRGLAFEERAYAVTLASERYVGHVAQADLFALRGGHDDDVAELLGRGDLRGHGHRIGIGGAVGRRFGPELSGRVDAALIFDGGGDGRNRDAVVFQHVGPEPYAHGVLSGAHDRDLAHAVDLQQFVLKVDVGVIREEFVVVASVAVQREDQQETRHGLARGDALLGHRRRKLGRGRGYVVLSEDGVEVGIGPDVEGHLHDH